MATKKGTKNIKVRDLKPKKDAKGGGHVVSGHQQGTTHQQSASHGVTRPGNPNT
jgi:hypothetical protein